MTKNQLDVIIEIVYNALKGNLNISSDVKDKLKRHRHIIRLLVSKGLTRSKRKKILKRYFKLIITLIRPCEEWI